MTLDQRTVEQEVENWVCNYLDKPSKHYGGHRPCPFAKPALEAGEVQVLLGGPNLIRELVTTWDDTFRVIVLCVAEGHEDFIRSECSTWNNFFAEAHSDLILIPFLPENEDPEDPELDPDEWGALTDEAYSMVFVQRVHDINKYSHILERRGYYKHVSPEFWSWVQQRRTLSKRV